jgi:hypothetical protein
MIIAITHALTPTAEVDGMTAAITHMHSPSPPRWGDECRHHSHALTITAEVDGMIVAITHTHSQSLTRTHNHCRG